MKVRVFILLLLFPMIGMGQRLTITELISFVKKDVEAINIDLASKGWSFINTVKYGENQTTSCGYNFSLADSSASAWLYLYSHDSYFNMVTYQSPSPQVYTELVRGIMAFNPKVGVANITNDGAIEKTYFGANYWYKTETKSGGNLVTISAASDEARREENRRMDAQIIDTIQLKLLYTTKLKKGIPNASIFQGYSSDTKVLYKVKPTDSIDIYGEEGDYYWVIVNDVLGYVSKKLLEEK